MDIQRPSNARAKKIKRIAYVTIAVVFIAGVTLGLSRLRPAAPSVDRGTVWSDVVKRGPMLREVRGLGTLVPEDIRWIPAQTASRVDRIVIRPGHIVQPNTIILELSNPELQRDVLDAQYQLKAAEADYANLKVTLEKLKLDIQSTVAQVDADANTVIDVVKQMKKAGTGIVGMKILGQGAMRNRPSEAIRFALGSGVLDAFTIGAENRKEQDDLTQRIAAA